jgi:hypothetical protein
MVIHNVWKNKLDKIQKYPARTPFSTPLKNTGAGAESD